MLQPLMPGWRFHGNEMTLQSARSRSVVEGVDALTCCAESEHLRVSSHISYSQIESTNGPTQGEHCRTRTTEVYRQDRDAERAYLEGDRAPRPLPGDDTAKNCMKLIWELVERGGPWLSTNWFSAELVGAPGMDMRDPGAKTCMLCCASSLQKYPTCQCEVTAIALGLTAQARLPGTSPINTRMKVFFTSTV